MKNAISIIKTFLWCLAGVFIGRGIYQFIDYKMNPAKYEVQSAPWYTGLLVQGVITAIVVVCCLIVIFILKKRAK